MSEPLAKIANVCPVISGSFRQDDEEEAIEFYLCLCFDVLFEVFRFGCRRKLTKLERVGNRFHWLVEKYFRDGPFLRLDLELKPSLGFEEGLEAFIDVGIVKKEIAFPELLTVPRFLRFGIVKLDYSIGYQSIAEKCESFRLHLPSIKATLHDSNITCFKIDNDYDPSQSINSSTLLEHIRNIVSICDSSRGYSFDFALQKDSSWDMNVCNLIASILEMPAIASSSTVYIAPQYILMTLSQLPIEIISNWLNRKHQAMNLKQRERVFKLLFPVKHSQFQEMYDFLKQKFIEDDLPTIPFTLKLFGLLIKPDQVEMKTVVNMATNEQFSVSLNGLMVEIKRTRAAEEKKKNSQNSKD